MKFLAYLRSLAAKFFHRFQVEDDMEEELRSHIQHRADDLERSGLARAEAERRARIEFGGHVRFKEEAREALGGNFIETLIQDARFSLRVLRKSPGFTTVAVLTLAFAIGANATVFGVLNALILRPLNVPQPQSLYAIERASDRAPSQSYPDYLDLRDRNRSFEGLASYNIAQAGLDLGQNPSRAWLYEVSGNYFDVLGIQAVSWPIYPCIRRAWPEQRAIYRAHICVLAQPFSGRSWRGGPRCPVEQASFYRPRCSGNWVSRNDIACFTRFLCPDR